MQEAQTFVLGVPAGVQAQFMIEGAFDKILPSAQSRVELLLRRLDAIEQQIECDTENLAVDKLGDIALREDEFEQLIKVFFAEHGTKADLLATLAGVRAESADQLGANARVPQAYLEGRGPFPERLPWLLLVGQFLVDFHLMVERWADWAGAIVETWPDDVAAATPD